MDWWAEKHTAEQRGGLLKKKEEKYIYNNVAYRSQDSRVNTRGSPGAHRLYTLKPDIRSLRDDYKLMKSAKDHTTVGYDAPV